MARLSFACLWSVFLAVQSGRAPAAQKPVEAPARLDPADLLIYHNRKGQVARVTSIRDWQKRRAEILRGMQAILGPLPGGEKRCKLDLRIEEEVDCGDYVRRFITYASEPGSRVPAYLLVPKASLSGRKKSTGILCLHQTHALGQKVVVGLGDSPNDAYGVELAKRGHVCLAPAYPLLADYHPDLQALGYRSGTLKAIRDNRRGLDLLESLPYVRKNAFGAIGHSLGGHNAIFTAVIDERIKGVVSSCGFDSFADYMNGDIRGWTSERYMPGLLEYRGRLREVPFDFYELIGALAPRAIFVSAPRGDTNFKWRSVDAIAASASGVYALYHKPGNLQVAHPECGHMFPAETRESAYQFLEAQLR
jgi:dienelactone hydrolase